MRFLSVDSYQTNGKTIQVEIPISEIALITRNDIPQTDTNGWPKITRIQTGYNQFENVKIYGSSIYLKNIEKPLQVFQSKEYLLEVLSITDEDIEKDKRARASRAFHQMFSAASGKWS